VPATKSGRSTQGSCLASPDLVAGTFIPSFPSRWYDVKVTVSSTAPKATKMRIEVQREEDQRWLAEVLDLPGVMAYGDTRDQAVVKAEALALRVIADRIDHGESIPELDDLFVVSA